MPVLAGLPGPASQPRGPATVFTPVSQNMTLLAMSLNILPVICHFDHFLHPLDTLLGHPLDTILDILAKTP